ncbi:MAG: helix-turn-helix transcriptional regulator [Erysipelotrichia bacterium]|jgi:DNA-binding HxlR family transcriptional regulator|nr:helix-turn-helix transcriptional regulator [Erysipelotrichia bacterium]
MSEQPQSCPVEITLALLSSKWKILIIRELLTGTKRFSDIKRALGDVTQKMLTQSLRGLEEDGLIIRKVYPVVPPHVEYSLSELGQSLNPVIESMRAYGQYYRSQS